MSNKYTINPEVLKKCNIRIYSSIDDNIAVCVDSSNKPRVISSNYQNFYKKFEYIKPKGKVHKGVEVVGIKMPESIINKDYLKKKLKTIGSKLTWDDINKLAKETGVDFNKLIISYIKYTKIYI